MLTALRSTSANARVLQASSADLSQNTNGGSQCIDFCNQGGYKFAGTGNGYECCESLFITFLYDSASCSSRLTTRYHMQGAIIRSKEGTRSTRPPISARNRVPTTRMRGAAILSGMPCMPNRCVLSFLSVCVLCCACILDRDIIRRRINTIQFDLSHVVNFVVQFCPPFFYTCMRTTLLSTKVLPRVRKDLPHQPITIICKLTIGILTSHDDHASVYYGHQAHELLWTALSSKEQCREPIDLHA
jgi:hypothetical protein